MYIYNMLYIIHYNILYGIPYAGIIMDRFVHTSKGKINIMSYPRFMQSSNFYCGMNTCAFIQNMLF